MKLISQKIKNKKGKENEHRQINSGISNIGNCSGTNWPTSKGHQGSSYRPVETYQGIASFQMGNANVAT